MKNKNLVMRGLVCLLLVPCFVIPFVSMFVGQTVVGNTTTIVGEYGIFGNYETLADQFAVRNGELAPFWMTLTSIMVVALAVLALVYIVLLVLDIANKKNKNISKISKFVGFLIVLCSVVALISAIIAICANNITGELAKTTAKLVFGIGSWLLIAPALAGGISLFIPATKASSKKK
ncbi:MAG: hypothetical protein IJW24_01085 [Clostridia bacterium]|nr:hypothetical protein [Clostridia bacterium]